MTNYEKIKSMLEYGHKVEVKRERDKFVFIGVYENEIINEDGIAWDECDVNNADILSITPIPHHYKKLEVGTKVDVIKGLGLTDLENHAPWEIVRYCEGGYEEVELKFYPWNTVVPLWALIPHVEEENQVKGRVEISLNIGNGGVVTDNAKLEVGKEKLLNIRGKTYKVSITEEL